MKMSRGELFAYVAGHPNTTSDDLARAFGISLTDAAGRLSRASKRGELRREVARYSSTGHSIYGYTVVEEKKSEPKLKSRQPEQKAAKIAPSTFDLSGGIAVLAENIAKQIASQVVHALQWQLTRELAGRCRRLLRVTKYRRFRCLSSRRHLRSSSRRHLQSLSRRNFRSSSR